MNIYKRVYMNIYKAGARVFKLSPAGAEKPEIAQPNCLSKQYRIGIRQQVDLSKNLSHLCPRPHGIAYVHYAGSSQSTHFLAKKNAELAVFACELLKNMVTFCTAELLLFAILCWRYYALAISNKYISP